MLLLLACSCLPVVAVLPVNILIMVNVDVVVPSVSTVVSVNEGKSIKVWVVRESHSCSYELAV